MSMQLGVNRLRPSDRIKKYRQKENIWQGKKETKRKRRERKTNP